MWLFWQQLKPAIAFTLNLIGLDEIENESNAQKIGNIDQKSTSCLDLEEEMTAFSSKTNNFFELETSSSSSL